MKVIAAVNNKGGVGKTKTISLIGEYIGHHLPNIRLLTLDLDPQCNFSNLYLSMEVDPAAPEGMMPPIHPDYDASEAESGDDGRYSISDIFYGKGFLPYSTRFSNIDIAPGHASKLLEAEAVRRTEVEEKVHQQLALLLASPEVKANYDLILIDTAPSKSPLTVAVVKAATDIFIPTLMEEQPIQGMYGMLQLWMQEATARPKDRPLTLLGILPNMFDKTTSLHSNMLESLMRIEKVAKYIMPFTVGDRIAFAERDAESAQPKSIFELPKSNSARMEAVQFCEYIMEKINVT